MRVTNQVNMTMGDSGSLDAFGRMRMSGPFTLFDSKQLNDNQPLLWDDQEESGSGTTTSHSSDTASTTIGVGANTAGVRTRQTFQRFGYQPGKSQLVLVTGQMVNQDSNLSGITTGMGLYDDNNGLFFMVDDGVYYVVKRSSTSGSPVDTKVAQSDWNIDRMDGLGPSQKTINLSKCAIGVIDFEWLGVGRVRMGWNIDGVTYYVHEFLHANSVTNVYMSTPNLPLRYQIENDGTGAATTMQHICSAVLSEGGVDPIGSLHEVDNGITEVTATTNGTNYALLGVRLNSSYLTSVVDFVKVSVLMTSAGFFHWELRLNPTVANAFSYSQLTNAGIDYAVGTSSNTVTGGKSLSGEYGASTGSGGNASGIGQATLQNAIKLGSAIDGTVDTMVLVVTASADNATFLGSLVMRET